MTARLAVEQLQQESRASCQLWVVQGIPSLLLPPVPLGREPSLLLPVPGFAHHFIPTVDSARNWHSEAKSIWNQPRNKGYCCGSPWTLLWWAVFTGQSLQTLRVNICLHEHSSLPRILPPWEFICKAQNKPALMAQLLDRGNKHCAENLVCGLTL